MKKLSLILAVVTVMIAATSCTKESVRPNSVNTPRNNSVKDSGGQEDPVLPPVPGHG